MKYYQFVDEMFNFKNPPPPVAGGATVTNGWEIDVVDSNSANPHTVLVCAQSSNYTTCNNGQLNNNDDSIYVIANTGTFEVPNGPPHGNLDRLVYHDGNKDYDYISSIWLGGSGGTQETCGKSVCHVFLSKTPN